MSKMSELDIIIRNRTEPLHKRLLKAQKELELQSVNNEKMFKSMAATMHAQDYIIKQLKDVSYAEHRLAEKMQKLNAQKFNAAADALERTAAEVVKLKRRITKLEGNQ